ncbi:hypothetical protein Cni_G22323 [Canna indica]|uniref:Uncharacterized protein n=1 Tax=Canna indica TaxID=4628 RepID=A0AAQ3KUX7_9LILI|nr:hypothetical protein Cni_G22323 [Canna indica]
MLEECRRLRQRFHRVELRNEPELPVARGECCQGDHHLGIPRTVCECVEESQPRCMWLASAGALACNVFPLTYNPVNPSTAIFLSCSAGHLLPVQTASTSTPSCCTCRSCTRSNQYRPYIYPPNSIDCSAAWSYDGRG